MNPRPEKTFAFGPFRLDVSRWELTRDGIPLALEPQVFRLLQILVERRGQLVEKSQLIALIWPDTHVGERTLTQQIYVLRRTLGEFGNEYISTVPRMGYRFVGAVAVLDDADSEPPPTNAIDSAAAVLFARDRAQSRWVWVAALTCAALIALAAFVVRERRSVASSSSSQSVARLNRITDHGEAKFAAMAPDASRVAYVRSGAAGESLWTVSADGSSAQQIVAADARRFQGITYHPTLNAVYYVHDFTLYRVALDDGVPHTLIRGVDRPVAFSADGARLAFIRDDVTRGESAIYVAASDGSDPRIVVVRQKPMFYRALTWSPDHDVLAASGGYDGHDAMSVALIDIASGKERTLQTAFSYVGELGWRRDHSSLVAVVRPRRDAARQIVEIDVTTGTAAQMTADLDDYRSVSVNHTDVIASVRSSQHSNLWMVTHGSSDEPTAITSGSGDYQYPVWISNNHLIYQHRIGGRREIYRMQLDDRTRTRLTSEDCDSYAPTATSSGDWVVFVSACAGSASIWRMRADGSAQQQVTFGDGDNFPSITGDGKWIYYDSLDAGKPIIKRIPLAGGQPERVTSRLSRMPSISPKGDLLAAYYWDERPESAPGVALLSPDTGTPVGVIPVWNPARRWPFVRWHPDGLAIMAIGGQNDPENVWGYPVDGGASTAFTNLTGPLETFSFAWSPDHKKLIVARGQSHADVVLITRSNEELRTRN